MSTELFWLVLTIAMTGLLWVPTSSTASWSAASWPRWPIRARKTSRSRLGRSACWLRIPTRWKIWSFSSARFDRAGAGHRYRRDRVCLRALFLGAPCACRGLHAGHTRVPHTDLRSRLRRAGAVGVGNLQTHLKFSLRAEELACAVYGNNATCSRPVVSGRPSMTFMFCTAWPEAPLVRLSSAETIMARPGTRSPATPIKVILEPRTCRVCGVAPNGSTWTNGSGAYLLASSACRSCGEVLAPRT